MTVCSYGDAGDPVTAGNLKPTWVLVIEIYLVTSVGLLASVFIFSLGYPWFDTGKPVPLAVTVTSPLKPMTKGVIELIVI